MTSTHAYPYDTADTRDSVAEYVATLKGSTPFGPPVVDHRRFAATSPEPALADLLVPELQDLLVTTGISHLHSHQRTAIETILTG